MKKRILQIISTLGGWGAGKQMSLLAQGLSHEEFDVHVCALGGGPLPTGLTEAGIPVAVIGQRWQVDPQAYSRLVRHVAGVRPDLIHTWLSAASAYGLAAGRACGVEGLVATQRSVDPSKGWIEPAVDRFVARRFARVAVNSPAVRDSCTHRGLPAEKIRVIPSGVARAEPSSMTRGQLLAELGLPENSRLVAVVGRLRLQKRIKDAIWAADLLKVIRKDVHLLVIGEGPHRDRLHTFREQVVIRDTVHFLGYRSDVPRLMPHFDALWSTSAHEGQSNAIMEAMAAGLPVVATDVPGSRELVVHAQTGYLVPVGHRAGFARYTQNLLSDAGLAQRLGQAGQARMQRDFSMEGMVGQYAALYRELLAQAPPALHCRSSATWAVYMCRGVRARCEPWVKSKIRKCES